MFIFIQFIRDETINLICNFFRDENPKPTVALDYTFGRRPRGHKMVPFLKPFFYNNFYFYEELAVIVFLKICYTQLILAYFLQQVFVIKV